MTQDAKRTAARAAIDLIRDNMLIGLGTGTTTQIFIHLLNERVKKGLKIRALASSKESQQLAKQGGIPLLDPATCTQLDLTVDGADEIDSQKRMIKGGGGALVREKIVAAMSKKMVVIVDSSKLVDRLGKRPLPVEVIPFGAEATKKHLQDIGYKSTWRHFTTDNGNWILDIHFDTPRAHPEKDHAAIIDIPGVVDTGFFFNLAHQVIIGYPDGRVETR